MPVSFLSPSQRDNYARYPDDLSAEIVISLFFLNDQDLEYIACKRGNFSRLGYALQLTTVRFLGTFITDLTNVPHTVVERIASQIKVDDSKNCLSMYQSSEQRWRHAVEIRLRYGYVEFAEKGSRFRLGRILCALCWTGTDRPGVLFDHAMAWMCTNKILLPGVTVLERFVAEIRSRMESRLWRMLIKNLTYEQQDNLSALLVKNTDENQSLLDKLRKGPVGVSSSSLVQTLKRVESARSISVKLPLSRIPPCRIAALARFANTAKITAISRLPFERKMATLVAFAHHFESSAQDDALDVLSMVLRDLFSGAKLANNKTRLRTIKDLDQAAATLVDACKLLLDSELSDYEIRDKIYTAVGHEALIYAVQNASSLIRPPGNVFYHELGQKQKTVRRFLPAFLRVIHFESNQSTGLNDVTVPGTLRDSLILLGVVLEQQTELQPVHIMTDTGAYSDVVFGLFRLLGYRFSPRLADMGGARFWRIDPIADYGKLNVLAKNNINFDRITPHWDDVLRLLGALKLGRVPATGIMRTLQVGNKPTRLALAIAEIGRIDKTIHMLNYLNDESCRRSTLLQLNLGEGRHSLARSVFHGKRGELHQRYRDGQENQLGALGLVLNMIVLWNTIYMDAAVNQLRQEGLPVLDEDVARLSPFGYGHLNMLGRYSFAIPEEVRRGELRPLRTTDYP